MSKTNTFLMFPERERERERERDERVAESVTILYSAHE
jgi:hypothetical protein